MFILRDLLTPLQEEFSNTKQGQKRKVWFAYTLLAVVVPFTSSTRQGKMLVFESKMEQAALMIKEVRNYFQQSVLIVTDSWFGNDGLWSRLDRESEGCFHLLSRMRTNITLYDFAPVSTGKRKLYRSPANCTGPQP